MPPRSDPEQCALDENGQLKDANDIQWFNSPSDKTCIPLPPVEGETVVDGAGTSHHAIYLAILSAQHYSCTGPTGFSCSTSVKQEHMLTRNTTSPNNTQRGPPMPLSVSKSWITCQTLTPMMMMMNTKWR